MEHLLQESLILLVTALVAVGFFVRFGLPTILAYILSGLALTTFFGSSLLESEGVHFLSELGIAFMLFMVGLELSVERVIELRRIVFLGGGLQVLVCGLFGFWLFNSFFGLDVIPSLIVAGALSMSSTALVLKQLSERKEIMHHYGRNAVGILLFQDIATIPLLVLIASLGGIGATSGLDMGNVPYEDIIWSLFYGFSRAIVLFTFMYVIGKFLLTGLVRYVIQMSSEDLRLLLILCIVLGASYVAELSGASMPLGAFLAGIIIGETKFLHEVESDLKPFRNILVGLFFITLGIQFDFTATFQSIDIIVSSVILLALVKAIIIFFVIRFMKRAAEEAALTAIVLAQGGEFGLLAISLALQQGLLPVEIGQSLIISIILSMSLAPLLIKYKELVLSLVQKGGVKNV